MNTFSPLRYPGGKTKICFEVANLINKCELNDKVYVEPFGGGFGIGLFLLKNNVVNRAVLNDYDSHVYNFWWYVFNRPKSLIKKIIETPITLEEREKQKNIYNRKASTLNDAFATLYLNRVNFSGIIKGGPLGGLNQKSKYKINCRFNKDEIIKKINDAYLLRDRIELYNYDAEYLITKTLKNRISNCFFNIDPPYVLNGKELYTCYFTNDQHESLYKTIDKYLNTTEWIVTYDKCKLIKDLYSKYTIKSFSIWHSARDQELKKELVISNINRNKFVWKNNRKKKSN